MTIAVDITHNLDKLEIWLNDATVKMLPLALKRSLVRASKTLISESTKAVRQQRSLKARDVKARWFKLRKNVGGRDISKMFVILHIKNKSIPFSMIIRGSTTPKSQKGIAVKRRKPVRVRLTPGKSKRVQGGFLAKGPKSGRFEVFRRESVKTGPIFMQSAPSIHLLFMDKVFRRQIEAKVGKQLQKEFMSQFENLLQRAASKN